MENQTRPDNKAKTVEQLRRARLLELAEQQGNIVQNDPFGRRIATFREIQRVLKSNALKKS